MPSSLCSFPSRRTLPLLTAPLLLVLLLALLAGCSSDGAANQSGQTPLSNPANPTPLSTAIPGSNQSTPPLAPRPVPTRQITPSTSPPDAVATREYIRVGPPFPTATPTPTIDPAAPTATPSPTLPPPPPVPPLTSRVSDPRLPGVEYFPPTGHTLRGVFLDYWTKNGGLAQFGNPLTEEFMESNSPDDKLLKVQYFEGARLEQRPKRAGTTDEVQVVAGGTQLAQQKGYFTGSYPRYGYAIDFSWLSGQLIEHEPVTCSGVRCGCSTLKFGDTNNQAQLEGPFWRLYERRAFINAGKFLIVQGHIAGPDERNSACPIPFVPNTNDKATSIFVVGQLQENAVP